MNREFCEAVEIVEVVEYANPEAPNRPGRRGIWGPDRTQKDRVEARKAGARFFWTIAGRTLAGQAVLTISERQQDLVDLRDFLNSAMGWHYANIKKEKLERKDSAEYGVSLWLEKRSPEDDMDFTYGVQICTAPNEQSAMQLLEYAETLLETALNHPRIPKEDSGNSDQ